MKTLIELYDERPVENVISTEMFRPDTTVFICSEEVARDKRLHDRLREYFEARGVDTKLVFVETSVVDAESVSRRLREVIRTYPDPALDIAGGTDAALFAGGLVSADTEIPVFTYSRRQNRYYNIRNASFVHKMLCPLEMKVKDCILMAGGSVRTGRVDNSILDKYEQMFVPFFDVFMKYRRDWNRLISYIQKISQGDRNTKVSLNAEGEYQIKGERGQKLIANTEALKDIEKIGMISKLKFGGEKLSFRFKDEQCRAWLRDVGSVLELYVYQCCRETGAFGDVHTSVIVDWQGDGQPENVTNEIDVMATRGIRPTFISCKVCEVKTEALNELAILRDRFGNGIARAAIVTAERGRGIMRHRAQELGIDVIDLDDLKAGKPLAQLADLSNLI